MNEDEKYMAAMAQQNLSQNVPYPGGGSIGGLSPGMSDFHIRSLALEVALRHAKTSEPFPDILGRARVIYMFLTEKLER